MSDLLVHADAGRAWKVVGQLRSRTCAGSLQQCSPDPVELGGGHARLERLPHCLQDIGDDAPDLFQAREVLVIRDCHVMLFRKPGHSPWEGGLQTEEIASKPRSDLVEQDADFSSQVFDSEGLWKQMLAGIEHTIVNDCIARVAGG